MRREMKQFPYGIDTVDGLANLLYDGKLSNLAETLARHHGQASALSFLGMMGEGVQNFWRGIAQQLIEHSKHWLENEGCGCRLDDEEDGRLSRLPRVGQEKP